MQGAKALFQHPRLYEIAQSAAQRGQSLFTHDHHLANLPGLAAEWTKFRDLRPLPKESFREWWKTHERTHTAEGKRSNS
jgi:L-lactate dehydrogenase complex protein LldF